MVNSVIHATTAREFIEVLRRSNPLWLEERAWVSSWVFRGQRNADWELQPSAWRSEVATHEFWKFAENGVSDGHIDRLLATIDKRFLVGGPERLRRLVTQRRFESIAVHAFAAFVDELGFRVPGDRLPGSIAALRLSYEVPQIEDECNPFHPAVALAQHHGSPTRLLDWTTNPLAAAFFASVDADPESNGAIAVWALDRRVEESSPRIIRTFTVPRCDFGFLHAQDGLFTYLRGADCTYLVRGAWPRLADCVPPESLKKITLPYNQVPELRRLLSAERISRAHLMPTLDNVQSSLRQNWKYYFASQTQQMDSENPSAKSET